MIELPEDTADSAPVDRRYDRRPDIAFVTSRDPMNLRSWSGIHHFMVKALQKNCGEVHCLGPVKRSAVENAERVFNRVSRLLVGRGYDYAHSTRTAKRYARLFKHKLSAMSADFIFAPVAATEIAYLDHNVPIIYGSDATVATLKDYYANYSDLFGFSVREAHSIEKLAIRKASLLIYPSHFAAESAIRDYQAAESKIHVIPYGANLEEVPARETVLRQKKMDECRLVLVGVDWVRKGGEIAVETMRELRAMGIRAHLTICGCVPPASFHAPDVEVVLFLDKRDPAQRNKLTELYLASHIFLLPTRIDLSPIVLCEANAFGLPVITTNVGGIPDIVTEGENGYMLPLNARGPKYATVISEIWQNQERYSALARSSRRIFEQRLNWDAWATTVGKLLPSVPQSA